MTSYWEEFLLERIRIHINETNSKHAKNIIDNWDKEKYLFWQVIPKEMINKFKNSVLVETFKTA